MTLDQETTCAYYTMLLSTHEVLNMGCSQLDDCLIISIYIGFQCQ